MELRLLLKQARIQTRRIMPKINYVVVGFPKCGQVSADKYLRDKYPDTPRRAELAWRDDGISKWTNIIRGHTFQIPDGEIRPYFVTRDPIERIWSAYLFFGHQTIGDYPTYLINRLYQPYGEGNPIMQSNYEKWLKPWQEYHPKVVELEDLNKIYDFPHMNITKDTRYKNVDVPEFTEEYRQLAVDLLSLELKDLFWEGDHETGFPTPEAWEILKPFNPGKVQRNDYRQRA